MLAARLGSLWAAAVVVVTAAAPVWALDGDCVASYSSGAYTVLECLLCDGDHSATDCMEMDLHQVAGGLPSYLVFDLSRVTGCSGAPAVDARGLDRPLGVPFVYSTLTIAGTSSVRVDPLRHRFLDADVDAATSADCTDLEVVVRLYYQRAPHD